MYEVKPYGHLIVNAGDFKGNQIKPTLARARVRNYDGQDVELNVHVVSVSKTHVCVRQVCKYRGEWFAWVKKKQVTPL